MKFLVLACFAQIRANAGSKGLWEFRNGIRMHPIYRGDRMYVGIIGYLHLRVEPAMWRKLCTE